MLCSAVWVFQNQRCIEVSPVPPARTKDVNHDVDLQFIDPKDFRDNYGDIYSGMWWTSIDSFLNVDYSKTSFLEQITLKTFNNNDRVIQTFDVSALAVEHMSKYFKHFSKMDTVVQNRVDELIEQYIQRTKEMYEEESTFGLRGTIALLPLRVTSMDKTYEARALKLQLASTLASLWKVGLRRAVVVGVSKNESEVAHSAFDMLTSHLELRSMELQYVHVETKDDSDWKLVPKLAMVQFQRAIREFNNSTGDTRIHRIWLGENPSQWKHVYFTEPDLILHLKSDAVKSLSNELEKGFILNAHRLQPIPHTQQFTQMFHDATISNPKLVAQMKAHLLPNLASFSAVYSMSSDDVCCDQGMFYPSHKEDSSTPVKVIADKRCHKIWEFCGFDKGGNYSDWSYVLENHKLLLTYPFISFDEGTGLPLVHHGQRVCAPQRNVATCPG